MTDRPSNDPGNSFVARDQDARDQNPRRADAGNSMSPGHSDDPCHVENGLEVVEANQLAADAEVLEAEVIPATIAAAPPARSPVLPGAGAQIAQNPAHGRHAMGARWTIVGSLTLIAIGALACGLVYVERTVATRPEFPSDDPADYPEAIADLQMAESEMQRIRTAMADFKNHSAQWREEDTALSQPPSRSPFLTELSRLLTPDYALAVDGLRKLKSLGGDDEDWSAAEQLIRDAMYSGEASLNNIGLLIAHMKNARLQDELLLTISTAEQARHHYRPPRGGWNGLWVFFEQLPADRALAISPVVVELSPSSPQTAQYLQQATDAQRAALAHLAFDASPQVTAAVRATLSEEQLFRAALDSLAADHQRACLAAEWLAEQNVDAARRRQVIDALAARLWLSPDGRSFPAMQALATWGNQEDAELLARIGRRPGAEMIAEPICTLLVKRSSPKLTDVIHAQLENPSFNERVSPLMESIPEVAAAVRSGLKEAVPSEAHLPYLNVLVTTATADDLPWLRDYQARLGQSNLRPGTRVRTRIRTAIQRLSLDK